MSSEQFMQAVRETETNAQGFKKMKTGNGSVCARCHEYCEKSGDWYRNLCPACADETDGDWTCHRCGSTGDFEAMGGDGANNPNCCGSACEQEDREI